MCDFTRKRPFCVLSPHPLGDLEVTYDVHLRFIAKLVVAVSNNFELFSLGVAAEALRRNID